MIIVIQYPSSFSFSATVIPANAGIQLNLCLIARRPIWIPAFAGMTASFLLRRFVGRHES
jgi:hypothetical protein